MTSDQQFAGRGTPPQVVAGVLVDFLRSRTGGPAAQEPLVEIREPDDLHDADADADLMDRLQEMYLSALPDRVTAITSGARSGDAAGVESAAYALAGTSGQLGHPAVASICRAIARDARRGILAHARLAELRRLLAG